MVRVRIVLSSSDSDSRLVLADNNPAACRLSRPGEAIYNASSDGSSAGNNFFQVVRFEDGDLEETRQFIARHSPSSGLLGKSARNRYPPPLVFKGDEPAALAGCAHLAGLLRGARPPAIANEFPVWLGEPVEIKPPTSFTISNRSGCHFLVVDKNEQEAIGILLAAVIGILAQTTLRKVSIRVLDLATVTSPWADLFRSVESGLGSESFRVISRKQLPATLEEFVALSEELEDSSQRHGRRHYLFLLGMHRIPELRADLDLFSSTVSGDDNVNLPAQFATILRDGADRGVHVFAWCDIKANLDRVLDRQLIYAFGTRIVGRMPASDSQDIIDSGKAANLDRPHRVMKYDDQEVGVLETLRPYSLPEAEWLSETIGRIRTRWDNMTGGTGSG